MNTITSNSHVAGLHKMNATQKTEKATLLYSLGVKVRNTKVDLNIYGTWRRVMFEKLMMKI